MLVYHNIRFSLNVKNLFAISFSINHDDMVSSDRNYAECIANLYIKLLINDARIDLFFKAIPA